MCRRDSSSLIARETIRFLGEAEISTVSECIVKKQNKQLTPRLYALFHKYEQSKLVPRHQGSDFRLSSSYRRGSSDSSQGRVSIQPIINILFPIFLQLFSLFQTWM